MIVARAMNVCDHTAIKKCCLLYLSFTYSAWIFEGYSILYYFKIEGVKSF